MPQSPLDPEQTTDVDELLESSGCINPNVGVTIAPMSGNRHRRNPSNISKGTNLFTIIFPLFSYNPFRQSDEINHTFI